MDPQNKPNSNNGPKDDQLFFKFDFDPCEIIIQAPTIDEVEHWLASHLKVLLHRDVLDHLIECLSSGSPLDSNLLSEHSERSIVAIEERCYFSWEDDELVEQRHVIISRPIGSAQDDASQFEDQDTIDEIPPDFNPREPLALRLEHSAQGRLEVALFFQSETPSTTINQLNERWKIFDDLAVAESYGPFNWDLSCHAQHENFDAANPLFHCGMLDVTAHPVPISVPLEMEIPDVDNDKPSHPEVRTPDQPLVLGNPTPEMVSTIASLSGFPLSVDCARYLLRQAQGSTEISERFFYTLDPKLQNHINIHTRAQHILDGEHQLRCSSHIDYSSPTTPIALSLEFRPWLINSDNSARAIEVCFHWLPPHELAQQNWKAILQAAGFSEDHER
jgi:hypothetical protein